MDAQQINNFTYGEEDEYKDEFVNLLNIIYNPPVENLGMNVYVVH
jgi:hypothetical protein